jgi:hypothetical protein
MHVKKDSSLPSVSHSSNISHHPSSLYLFVDLLLLFLVDISSEATRMCAVVSSSTNKSKSKADRDKVQGACMTKGQINFGKNGSFHYNSCRYI